MGKRRLIATAAALALAGCGASHPVLPAPFAHEVAEVCDAYWKAVAALPHALPGTPQQMASMNRRAYALLDAEIAQLRRLRTPAAARARYQAYTDAMADWNAAGSRIESRALIGSEADRELEAQLSRAYDTANTDARRLGLTECIQPPGNVRMHVVITSSSGAIVRRYTPHQSSTTW
jgi:hypothetical protein